MNQAVARLFYADDSILVFYVIVFKKNQENVIDLFKDKYNGNGDDEGRHSENKAGGSSFRKWFVVWTHIGEAEL